MKIMDGDRRDFLKNMASIAGCSLLFSACSTLQKDREARFVKINPEIHWARRKEWHGKEYVFAVVQYGDFTLMVQRNTPIGWTLPGGVFQPRVYGRKSPKGSDLVASAADFVLMEASVPVVLSKAVIFAYGYAIDQIKNETYLAHWLSMAPASTYPPVPHANLRSTTDAKWVTMDDPKLGKCLRQRVNESKTAGEGSSVMIKSC